MATRLSLSLSPPAAGLLARLAAFFRGRGSEAYVTGGFLRDALLGRESRDVDLAAAADPLALGPELAEALGGRSFPLAPERGILRIVLPGQDLHVDLLPLRGDIESDLRLRDYTIDAMAAPLAGAAAGAAEIIDPTGGHPDLRRRLVRVVREEAFREDPLRPLRGVRLAAELDFRLERGTTALIRAHAPRLPEAAPERQRDELMRTLATPRAGGALRLLDDLGLLAPLLPEVAAARGVEQPKEHYWDVFGHSLEAVRALDFLLLPEAPADEPWRSLWREVWEPLAWWQEGKAYFQAEVVPGRPRLAVLKLAALLHDIAKPETKTWDETGRMRFFGHADVGAEKAVRILRRLRLSGREVELVRTMVKAHLRPVQMGQQGPPTRRALYRYFRDCGDAAIDTLFLSLADHLATVGPRVSREGWRNHASLVNYILTQRFQEESIVAPPRLVNGHDLMRALGLAPGPLVGRLLRLVEEAQAAGEVKTREEALELARSALGGDAAGPSRSEET